MFTGLIQGLGQLHSHRSGQLAIATHAAAIMQGLALGDSIAVDGVCLTVETIQDDGFTVTTSAETLERSTLNQQINQTWQANLEPALKVGDRLGGHFVTGHVDGVGKVVDIETAPESWTFSFEVPAVVARLIVEKGSIAINGISLTVANCDLSGQIFSVAVIPHSFGATNLNQLKIGNTVNLETDVLGKYVDRLINVGENSASAVAIDSHFLAEHGYG